MARQPGKESDHDLADDLGEAEDSAEASRGAIPELMRRALGMGLSGFFLTEETIRKALGDTLPQDWIDFAAGQSERTRAELLERLSGEIGRALENVDVAEVLRELLEGNTLEVNAEIRLTPRREGGSTSRVRIVRDENSRD